LFSSQTPSHPERVLQEDYDRKGSAEKEIYLVVSNKGLGAKIN
jgi:hypothetical protein